jgi:two-component system copper resistance phosphate regulon response regulator CusR
VRILLIEDDPFLLVSVQKALTALGYPIDLAFNGLEGRYLATEGDYSLVLLDVALAGPNLAVLQAIRRIKQTPVLMLTARDSVEDRLKGLQLGANDYLAMPFSELALQVRVQALLERRTPQETSRLGLASLEVDILRRQVARQGVAIKLSPNEFDLLAELLQHAGKPVSREILAQRVWHTSLGDESNTLEVTVRRLRKRLDDPFDTKLLHTVRGVGYMLADREG